MNLDQWLEATSTANGLKLTEAERDRRKAEREAGLKKAGTNAGSLRIARCRGSIGKDLARRLEAATKGTRNEFRMADQFAMEAAE
jgi:hypothetical protein